MNTNFKIAIQYLIFAILFIGISFLMIYSFCWRIDYDSAEFFIMVFSAMICWLGVGYLSTLISGKIIFKNIKEIGLVSPFTLVSNGFFYKEKGLIIAKKFKITFRIFAFSLFVIFIFLFYQIVNFIEKTQLKNYRIEKSAKIEKISYYKGSKRAHLIFEFDNKEIKKIVYLKDTFKNIGDYESIVFSSKNPYIVESRADYEKKLK